MLRAPERWARATGWDRAVAVLVVLGAIALMVSVVRGDAGDAGLRAVTLVGTVLLVRLAQRTRR